MRPGTFSFRKLTGSFDPVRVVTSPFDTTNPMTVIHLDAVQIDLTLSKFITISNGMRSSRRTGTTDRFFRLWMALWGTLGASVDCLGRSLMSLPFWRGGPPLIVITFWVGKTFENVTYI